MGTDFQGSEEKPGDQSWRPKLEAKAGGKAGGKSWRPKLEDEAGGQSWRPKLEAKAGNHVSDPPTRSAGRRARRTCDVIVFPLRAGRVALSCVLGLVLLPSLQSVYYFNFSILFKSELCSHGPSGLLTEGVYRNLPFDILAR